MKSKTKIKQPEVNTSQPGRFISKAEAIAHAEKFVADRYAEERKRNPATYYEKLGVLTAFAMDLVDPSPAIPMPNICGFDFPLTLARPLGR